MKFVLFQNSNTQRISVTVTNDSVLISKEFRKSQKDNWNIGKGITLPAERISYLDKVLACKDESELNGLLESVEIIKEETHCD